MTVFTIPGWLENAGAVHTAVQMRNYVSAMLDGTNGTQAKARGGINPRLGEKLGVTETASPSMAVLVGSGAAWIPGTEAAAQGLYGFFNDADVTVSITTAHATLARIDIVQARVRDSFYSGANNDAILSVKAGTPASSPVAPAADANAIILAEVLVGAGVTSIVNANITNTRDYMSGVGGIMQYQFEADPPASADIGQGMFFWSVSGQKFKVYDGTSFFTIWDRNVEGNDFYKVKIANKTATETVNNSTTLQNDNELFLPLAASGRWMYEAMVWFNSGTTPDFKLDLSLPAAAVHFSTATTWQRSGAAGTQGNDTRMFYTNESISVPGNGMDFNTQGVIISIKGLIRTIGTAGNAQIRWAQNTANASNTEVYVPSYLALTRVL